MTTAMPYPANQPCPCGSQRTYRTCCAPYLAGVRFAPTAEKLMRSRYTAYALRFEGYLLDTWHPSTRPARLALDEDEGVRWQKLEVRHTSRGGVHDTQGEVEFVAHYAVGSERHRLHEKSTFVRHEGRWLYVDGVEPRGT